MFFKVAFIEKGSSKNKSQPRAKLKNEMELFRESHPIKKNSCRGEKRKKKERELVKSFFLTVSFVKKKKVEKSKAY